MKYTLLPELDEAKKQAISEWIAATLAHPQLTQSSVTFNWAGQLAIYQNGMLRMLHRNSSWSNNDGANIYIGYRAPDSQPMPLLERLAVVGAIISLTETWPVHHEQFIKAASVALIDSYTGVMSGMVQTEAAVSGLAFNEGRSIVAARIGDCYHRPNGELVEIDDSWTVVADRPSLRVVPIAATTAA